MINSVVIILHKIHEAWRKKTFELAHLLCQMTVPFRNLFVLQLDNAMIDVRFFRGFRVSKLRYFIHIWDFFMQK